MRRLLLLLAVASLVLAVVAVPSASAATSVYEVHHVPTVDGATIRVEIQRDPTRDPQPVILTYSPYNNLNEDAAGRTATDGYWDRYGERGYARAVADVIGTRGSSGCWDYGGPAEQQSGVDVVNHLAGLEWSNGNVAMIGGSYEGTTATMVAARGDDAPGLKAIVPIAAISRWYDYAYRGGVRYLLNSFAPTDEGFDTPLAFDLGFGRTVPPFDPANAAEVAGARTGECGTAEHTGQAYSRHPDYGPFWTARDYLTEPSAFRAAAFVVHGWQDYNVKQVEAVDLYRALPEDDPATPEVEGVPFKLLWMTQATHAGGSGAGYQVMLDAFLEQTLYGVDKGLARLPEVRTEGRDASGALGPDGVQRTSAWPPPGTDTVALHLGRRFDDPLGLDAGLVGSTGETGVLAPTPQDTGVWTWVDMGTTSEPVAENNLLEREGHGYSTLYYASAPLRRDTRLAGSAVLDTWIRNATGEGTHLAPILLDVAPDGGTTVVERGFLNLDYRNGLEAADPLPADVWGHAEVELLPQDYTFRAGHRIALLTMSANTIWAVPGNPSGTVNIANGPVEGVTDVGSRLLLPIVGTGGDASGLFSTG